MGVKNHRAWLREGAEREKKKLAASCPRAEHVSDTVCAIVDFPALAGP